MNPAALLNQGVAEHRAGRLEQAAVIYRQILQRWPAHPDALYLLGLVVQKGGGLAEASELFKRATAANPKLARAHLQRGFCLNALGQPEEAVAAFAAAAAGDATLAEAHHQLGNTLRTLRRLPEALASLREATRHAPADKVIWLSRGVACMDAGQGDEAVESFQHAVKLDPALPEAREILGQALLTRQRTGEAREHLEAALRLRPDFVAALHDMGRLCVEEGRLADAAAEYRKALALKPEPDTQTNLLFLMNYLPDTLPEQHFAEHRRWAEWFEQPLRSARRPHENRASPERRLRLGFFSPDFREHAVASFIDPILRHYHREQFETIAYANVKSPDAVTRRLQGLADHWRDIYGWEPDKVAELVRHDGIDLLVDLAGHTTDNGLLVFARKPAPIQITWIGYPNTTGLEAMDYRLTDGISDPPGLTERWHSEELIRLPEAFSCYGPPAESPAVAPLPALANGYVTFGSFNNFRKVSQPAIALWARLLRELPTARLLLKSQGLGNPAVANRLRDQFVSAGVAGHRLQVLGAGMSNTQHLELYHQVDLALDPFPYNGTTTTCEAIWMGVPVITLAGQTHVARVGISLVSQLGYPQWAVASPEAYIAQCLAMARDLPGLAALRPRLREQLRQSSICDAHRFVGQLEAVFRDLWRRWCQGHPAESNLAAPTS